MSATVRAVPNVTEFDTGLEGREDTMDALDQDDRALVSQMLAEQAEEVRSHFDHPSLTIAHVVTHRPEQWLITLGTQLMTSDDASDRILGSRLVREVKSETDAVTLTVAMLLEHEQNATVIPWLISALGFLHASTQMSLILSFADHSDPSIRYAVSDAISACAGGTLGSAPRDALITLAGDPDPDVRWSAVFEIIAWSESTHEPALLDRLRISANDPEEPIRSLALEALAASLEPG